ncbi:uncharacterized protein LOC125742571 isoform X3 [Brienomyrus brachyistius]|uniref:uncharacterized protein LOC125742571 isoform X3 n=1 Tax=Brienomyrus brachyistius TaxID=42636 RepID=UPI0020B40E45|nr:uncharacterized protein LOC125742571 isoform X3 [Brienomyrus brachyistius]
MKHPNCKYWRLRSHNTAAEMEHSLGGLVLVITFLGIRATRENARIVTAEEGKSFTVKCSTTQDTESLHLYQRMESEKKVLYYFRSPPKCSPTEGYVGRVKTEDEMADVSITITNVTDDDSGLYWCSYNIIRDNDVKKFTSKITLVVVNANLKPCPPPEPVLTASLWVPIAICTGSVFLLGVFILLFCLGPTLKKACGKKKNYNGIYEDMRHPSVSRPKP